MRELHGNSNSDTALVASETRVADVSAVVAEVFPESVAALLGTDESASGIGTMAHSTIAILAPTAHTLNPDSLVETILVLARSVCPPGRMHRRNSTLVAGYATEYLRGRLRPRAPWMFLGAEMPVGSGARVDLAWMHEPTGAVLFDEVKTTETARRRVDDQWVFQTRKYAMVGRERFGEKFLGVRLLPLGSMNVATFVTASGDLQPLVPTMTDPLAGTGIAVQDMEALS